MSWTNPVKESRFQMGDCSKQKNPQSWASIPSEAMMHFPPCFRFPPYFLKIFRLENFQTFTSSRKISRFSSAKISDDLFLVIDHKFRIFPLFPLFQYISPLFPENYYFPYFANSPRFRKIHLLFTYFICISFPPTLTMTHLCITQCTYWMPLGGWPASSYPLL